MNDPAYGLRVVSSRKFDQSFTGVVLVFEPMLAAEEVGEQPKAEITLVEPYQASGSSQVRIWAEIDNPKGRLLPGSSAILTAYP